MPIRYYDPDREVLCVEEDEDLSWQRNSLRPQQEQMRESSLFSHIHKYVQKVKTFVFGDRKLLTSLPSPEPFSEVYSPRPEVLLILRKEPIEPKELMRRAGPNTTVIIVNPEDVREYNCLVAQPVASTRRRIIPEAAEANGNTDAGGPRSSEMQYPLRQLPVSLDS